MFTRSPCRRRPRLCSRSPLSVRKEGAGKTTLAIHLAVAAAHAGRHTAIIDLDPQASAAHWADRREAALPTVLAAPASRLRPELDRALATGVELLYLDTAPHSDSAALKVARAADLVLIPCRTAILDLEAITDTVQFLATTGTPALVVLNAVSTHGHDADQAADALHTLTLDVCPVRIGHRVAFARALLTGQAAQEYDPGSKAAAEVERLHTFVMKRVHSITPSQSGVLANG